MRIDKPVDPKWGSLMKYILIPLFLVSMVLSAGCCTWPTYSPELRKVKVKVLRFSPGNNDAEMARRGVLSELRKAGLQVVDSSLYDYAVEGSVEYGYDTPSGKKKIDMLTVLVLGKDTTSNTSTPGGLNRTSDPFSLGQTAGENVIEIICDKLKNGK